MYHRSAALMAIPTIAALLTIGCVDEHIAGNTTTTPAFSTAPAPSGVQTVDIFGDQLGLWPFTGTDLAGSAFDPINLIFRGNADPRSLRAALMALDGNRQAFGMPNVFPYNCTWSDAFGNVQTAFTSAEGWSASVIQLQCGSYAPLRFHIRLFPQGQYTLANAHFEVVIPGTADHQVLSWQAGKQLIAVDFQRSGLLGAAPVQIPGLHPVQYRSIPAVIYNGLPAALKQIAGGPTTATTAVPILSDGMVTVLTLQSAAPLVTGTREETLTIEYNQVVPRPFCATGPLDYVHLQGPVTLDSRVTQSTGGNLTSSLRAQGQLTVTPVNPLTGERGDPASAVILDVHEILFGENQLSAISNSLRKETRMNGEGTSLQIRLQVGGQDQHSRTERCSD